MTILIYVSSQLLRELIVIWILSHDIVVDSAHVSAENGVGLHLVCQSEFLIQIIIYSCCSQVITIVIFLWMLLLNEIFSGHQGQADVYRSVSISGRYILFIFLAFSFFYQSVRENQLEEIDLLQMWWAAIGVNEIKTVWLCSTMIQSFLILPIKPSTIVGHYP
ncbi:hypothetical protein ACJX0J_034708 [Zea mays]